MLVTTYGRSIFTRLGTLRTSHERDRELAKKDYARLPPVMNNKSCRSKNVCECTSPTYNAGERKRGIFDRMAMFSYIQISEGSDTLWENEVLVGNPRAASGRVVDRSKASQNEGKQST